MAWAGVKTCPSLYEVSLCFFFVELVVLSKKRQYALRQELVTELSVEDPEKQSDLEAQFEKDLLEVAKEMNLPRHERETISQLPYKAVFEAYGLRGAGGGLGLFALIRAYERVHSQDEVAALRRKMQDMAEQDALEDRGKR